MSHAVTEEEAQLTLLDIIGFPSEQMLFSSFSKTLIYSLGSNIVYYNLSTNSKTFVQYLTNEIILLKFLDDQDKYLVTIDRSPFPLLCIWELPSFTQIYNQEITIPSHESFSISNIFIEQIYQEIYLIVITSKTGINYVYILKNENELNNNYSLDLFKKLSYIKETIYGFKLFYNSKDVIFLLERNLLYYNIDLEKESYNEKMKIDFPFSLIPDSLRISKDVNLIVFLTIKGNCLIYDQNGNNKPSINPFGQEYFTSCEFEGDSLCIGTNHGKVYVYNIYDNKPKYFIHYKAILRIRDNFQLNSNNDKMKKENENNFIHDLSQRIEEDECNFGPEIKLICLSEKIDQIFLRLSDNSIILAPLSMLINDLNYQNDSNLNGNNIFFYAFNHSQNIDDIVINSQKIKNDNYSDYSHYSFDNNTTNNMNYNTNDELVIFSCSKDQKIIKYYVDYETNKLSNSFFNLKPILSNSHSQGRIMNMNNINKLLKKNENESMIYLTILKYHPLYTYKLFAGDNKGFLYLFDTKENKFQYKKSIIGTYELVSLEFSPDGYLLCIGFDTGCLIICNMRKDCEVCLQLNTHYMPVEESEFRKINSQIISFSYFFNNRNKYKDCLLYSKNNYLLEFCKLYYDRNRLNKKEIKTMKIMNQILDIKVHTGENYVIILNSTNQIIINNILSGVTTAVIDLNNKVKSVNNIQIDISGLFLGVICDLNTDKNNINNLIYSKPKINNKRNYVVIFEIGTGKVKTCINYINPISKIIFDQEGNYIIIAGQKGEISLWKLIDSMTMSIKNVLEEMKINPNFWEEYEIKYDNTFDYQNELINNSDFIINNRNQLLSNGRKVKHDINLSNSNIKSNSNSYKKTEIRSNSVSNKQYNNNNYNNNYDSSNTSSNLFRRNRTKNKNVSERTNDYNNNKYYRKDSIINSNESYKNNYENKNISKNDFSNNNFSNNLNNNITHNDTTSKFYNNISHDNNYDYNSNYNYDSDMTKKAPLLLDSKQILLKEKKNYKLDTDDDIVGSDNTNTNNYKDKNSFLFNNINKKQNKSNNFRRNKNDFERYINNSDYIINNNKFKSNYKLNNIDKDNNLNVIDNIERNGNNNIKETITNNNKINNSYNYNFLNTLENSIRNKDNNNNIESNSINGMNINSNFKNDFKRNSMKKNMNKNTVDTSQTNKSKSMKYINLNTYNENVPKLNHINLITTSSSNNRFYRTQTTNHGIKNNFNFSRDNNTLLSFKEKNEDIRQKNIKRAVDALLKSNIPNQTTISHLEKEKNIELTINQNEPKINLYQDKNIILNKNINKDIRTRLFSNNINNNNKNENRNKTSNNDINEDFIVISNKKINNSKYENDDKKENINNMNENNYDLISAEIKKKFGMPKKYPEPDDIDDNLITSHVEPIPDVEQHSKIQKIEADDINQFEKYNINQKDDNNINNVNNIIDINSQISHKDNDENKKKQSNKSNNKEMYIKTRIVDDNNLFKSSDEEFNENNDFE